MHVAVVSPYDREKIVRLLKKAGFVISAKPQFVFTYGGDGTILQAEQCFSGVPIVPVQKSRICSNCSVYSVSDIGKVAGEIKKGKFRIAKEGKVEAVFKGRKLHALNEIQLHVKDPRKALRFSVRAGKTRYRELIGDGLVAATRYGSTAYYRSLGYVPFRKGVRIGFNNVWPRLPALELGGTAIIRILREPAWLIADNAVKLGMKEGDFVAIRPSKKKARFVVVE